MTSPHVAAGLFSTDPLALLAGRCMACGALHFPRRHICPSCQECDIEEARLSSRGTVYTFTIVRMAPPGYAGGTPYGLGVVELPDGIRVTSTLTAHDLELLSVGDTVELELLTLGEDEPVTSFAFRRVGGAA